MHDPDEMRVNEVHVVHRPSWVTEGLSATMRLGECLSRKRAEIRGEWKSLN